MHIPKSHPRRESLKMRALIERGFEKGIVAKAGLVAHGRGEALDYLLGERTTSEAKKQIEAATAMLALAKRPVITVNGNTTALCARETKELAKALHCEIEINLFYRTEKRAKLIAKEFARHGVKVLGVKPRKRIKGLQSKRRFVDTGTAHADVVLVMLEDGDRTEYLKRAGKKVVAIDLNPISRTARMADITIVDNVVRALPMLARKVRAYKRKSEQALRNKVKAFDNHQLLKKSEARIRKNA